MLQEKRPLLGQNSVDGWVDLDLISASCRFQKTVKQSKDTKFYNQV